MLTGLLGLLPYMVKPEYFPLHPVTRMPDVDSFGNDSLDAPDVLAAGSHYSYECTSGHFALPRGCCRP